VPSTDMNRNSRNNAPALLPRVCWILLIQGKFLIGHKKNL
jgi:hypothetical protein